MMNLFMLKRYPSMLFDVDVATESGIGAVHPVHLVPTIELHYIIMGKEYVLPLNVTFS